MTDDRLARLAQDVYKLNYERGRNDGLDEAAKVADIPEGWHPMGKAYADEIARSIRALKSKPLHGPQSDCKCNACATWE